jgi:amino acid adenylation domain-containing protein
MQTDPTGQPQYGLTRKAHDTALSFDAKMLEDRAFWLRKLSRWTGAVSIPGDRPRPPGPAMRRGEARIEIAGELYERLARVTGGGPFLFYTTLVLTLRLCLYKYTSLRSVAVGSPARRMHDDLDEPANAVVIADEIDERRSFKQLLLQQRQSLLEAYARQSYPHTRLLKDLQRSDGRPPGSLFRIAIALDEIHGPLPEMDHDISLTFHRNGGGLSGKVDFSFEIHRSESIERLLHCFHNLLAAGLGDPGITAADLQPLSATQRHHLLCQWNATATDYPRDSSLPELFRAQVERTPEAVALAFGDEQVTYGALARRANGVASRLVRLGVGPGMLIGICAERSIELVVGILGILQAGAAYLPLDPGFPESRLQLILDDARSPVLLTSPQLANRFPAFRGHCEPLGAESLAEDLPAPQCTADDLAYVIYTSGSTGQPKGVAVPQRAVARLVLATDYVGLGPGDRIAQVSPMSFDAATFELWGTLLNGGCLVGTPHDIALEPQDFGEFLAHQRITTLFLTTALFNQMAREAPWGLRGLRDVLFGGEAVDPAAVRQVLSGHAPQRLLHVYGPTESTTFATWFQVTQVHADAATVPIGRPIANTRLFLIGADAVPVPPGGTGEVYLGGDGLSRGYIGDPVLTAQRFVPDPFSNTPGARLYRTGDFARLDADEAVEFLGRGDDQVKLRGFRIELGEIESVLRDHPEVLEAAALVREDTPGSRKLVAYVVPATQRQPSLGALRDHAAARLPSYMVPATFVLLDRLPLNANGKVDRRALPAPSTGQRTIIESHVAPRTPVEQVLANLFSEVLGVENVGIHDDFFVLGGHSLLATRIISRLRETFHVELPIRELFENPTVIKLAARVEAAAGSAWSLRYSPIERIDRGQRGQRLPLSFAQQRLWFIDRFEPGSSTYNMFSGFRIGGRLDVNTLSAAFSEIVRRHEVLRTVFVSLDGTPEQVILPPTALLPELIDLQRLEPAGRDLELRRIVEHEARKPFDLARGPLLRLALVRTEAEEHVFLMTMHHIVSDGWSIGVLIREIQELYGAILERRPSSLPDLPLQYADFSAWQRAWMDGQILAEEVEFWREHLRGLPPLLELPTDRPRQAARSSAGRTEVLLLPKALLTPLYELCQRCGVTPFMALLALFEILLYRYSGEEAFAVGTPVAGRNRLEIEGLIGFFVNILVLRADLSESPGFEALLARVRDEALEAYLHQDLPFEKLVEELQPERSRHHSAIFQVMFKLENLAAEKFHLGSLQMQPLLAFNPIQALYDLSLTINGERDALSMEMNARSELFDGATLHRMSHHLIALLAQAVVDPARPLDRFVPLSDAERAQLAMEWNDTAAAPFPSARCLHELFEAQVDRAPAATAIVAGTRELSYGEIEARANRLAHHLQALGVGPEVAVGICLERSPEMIVALLAVLKAGGAYLALDPSYPHSRLSFLIDDTRLIVLVGDERSLARLPPLRALTFCFERDEPAISQNSAQRPLRAADPANLAYVAYTSGSLGTPKGVMVEHRSASGYVATIAAAFGLTDRDRTVHFSSLSFDSSIDEVFASLASGATLVLATPDMVVPSRFLSVCREREITTLCLPTAFWHELSLAIEADPAAFPRSLRLLRAGGEKISVERVRRWLQTVGIASRLVNAYGPTETTVTATIEPILQPPEPHAEVSIGRPLAGVRIYVLDRDLSLAPVGVPGELCIGGAGVTRGYLDGPELTAERFIADPYDAEPGSRLYRTGDFARRLPDGRLVFLGRKDHQVKVRGFRIELGEIESLLSQHPKILNAVVVPRDDQPGGTTLAAFLATKEALTSSEIRSFLGSHLPDFMIPHHFVMLDTLPLTVLGKVDRPSLEHWDFGGLRRETAALPPRDHFELALALIWEELLGKPAGAVSVRDDFFTLGGHSLLAARLVAVMEERLGKQIPVHLVFQNPTIEQLAMLLRASGELPPAPCLLPIQPRGSRPPVFWVHPTGGSIFCYLELARHLAPDQPFFAFQASGVDGRRPLLPSVEEMAACYVQELLAAEPSGPYRLGGWSMGGSIAFEMARQLQTQGKEVASLVVLDYAVDREKSVEEETATALLIGFAKDLGLSPDQLPDPAWLSTSSDAEKLDYILQRARDNGILPPGAAGERLLDLFHNNIRATAAFRPAFYPGAVTLLRASSPASSPTEDLTLGWNRLATGGVQVHFVPGDHFTMLREPNVQTLAEVLLSLP